MKNVLSGSRDLWGEKCAVSQKIGKKNVDGFAFAVLCGNDKH